MFIRGLGSELVRRNWCRLWQGVVRFTGSVLEPAGLAHAHSGTESYAYVLVDDSGVRGTVQFPISDLNEVLGLTLSQDAAGALAELAANRGDIEAYAASHLDVGGWPLMFTGYRVLERKQGSYAVLEYAVSAAPRPVPRRFAVTYDGIMESKPHHHALILVKTWAGWGPVRTAQVARFECSASAPEHEVTLPDASFAADAAGAGRFLVAGLSKGLRKVAGRVKRMIADRRDQAGESAT